MTHAAEAVPPAAEDEAGPGVSLIWSLEAGGSDQPGIHSIYVDPRESRRVPVDGGGTRLAMGSTTGTLWLSENGGDSWSHAAAHLPPVYCVRFAE